MRRALRSAGLRVASRTPSVRGGAWFGVALLLVLLCVIASAKPMHVDDTLFVRSARAIAAGDGPLSWSANWTGSTESASSFFFNPPLGPTLLAAIGVVMGWSDAALHTFAAMSILLFAFAVLRLARESDVSKSIAVLLAVGSPAVTANACNVMPDVMCVGLGTLGWAEWMRSRRTGSRSALAVATTALVGAAMCKYVGVVFVVPCAWSALSERSSRTRAILALLLPVIAIGAYEAWHRWRFGSSAVGAAFERSSIASGEPRSWWLHVATALTFLGGTGLFVLVYRIGRVRPPAAGRVAVGAAAVSSILLAFSCVEVATESRFAATTSAWATAIVLVQIVGFYVVGVWTSWMLLVEARARTSWASPAAALAVATVVYAVFVNWDISMRALLPVVPALSVIGARSADEAIARSRLTVCAALTIHVLLGVLVAVGDLEVARVAKADAERHVVGDSTRFVGHWGFQHYAEARHATSVRKDDDKPPSGTVIVAPMLNSLTAGVAEEWVERSTQSSTDLVWPIATLGPRSGAGYYGSVLGPLPFGVNLREQSVVHTIVVR